MKYFAMIDGQRVGPLSLEQLPEAGVFPDTYVWCKGMPDWQKAEDVADICRLMRRRLAGRCDDNGYPPRPGHDSSVKDTDLPEDASNNRNNFFASRFPGGMDGLPSPGEFKPNLDNPPSPMILPAILSALFCFPLTGFVAIYFAWRSRQLWKDATSNSGPTSDMKDASPDHTDKMRHEAHDFARMAKMWTGITFFLGLILYAFLVHMN